MIQSTKFAPMNSLIFVSDSSGGEAPIPVWGQQLSATETCISVACYPEIDGETLFRLGAIADVDPGFDADFDGLIATPAKNIGISTVDGKFVLKCNVPRATTRVAIWRSHPQWPEEVTIGFE